MAQLGVVSGIFHPKHAAEQMHVHPLGVRAFLTLGTHEAPRGASVHHKDFSRLRRHFSSIEHPMHVATQCIQCLVDGIGVRMDALNFFVKAMDGQVVLGHDEGQNFLGPRQVRAGFGQALGRGETMVSIREVQGIRLVPCLVEGVALWTRRVHTPDLVPDPIRRHEVGVGRILRDAREDFGGIGVPLPTVGMGAKDWLGMESHVLQEIGEHALPGLKRLLVSFQPSIPTQAEVQVANDSRPGFLALRLPVDKPFLLRRFLQPSLVFERVVALADSLVKPRCAAG